VCGSFWAVEQIQNGGRCHGNQGAKNVKRKPYSGSILQGFVKFYQGISEKCVGKTFDGRKKE
jgi:hypothetical protein